MTRQYSGTLGKTAKCEIGISVHLVNERASCTADWRLFCPQSWDDAALEDPVAAARARRLRARARIPGEVRHMEKWRLGPGDDWRDGRAPAAGEYWSNSLPPTARGPW